jgi:hypothetical protein
MLPRTRGNQPIVMQARALYDSLAAARFGGGCRPVLPQPQVDLSTRVAQALAEARRQVDRSHVLLAAARLVEEPSVCVTCCAWCKRMALADRWLTEEETPRFLPPQLERRLTHGICPACFDELRRSGRSH